MEALSKPSSLRISHSKGTAFKKTQLVTIYEYLTTHIATVAMIYDATGIPEKSICRRKRDLEKEGRLWKVFRKHCQSTKRKAWYLTTNEALAYEKGLASQLKLWD